MPLQMIEVTGKLEYFGPRILKTCRCMSQTLQYALSLPPHGGFTACTANASHTHSYPCHLESYVVGTYLAIGVLTVIPLIVHNIHLMVTSGMES